jgi:hypothetical protein
MKIHANQPISAALRFADGLICHSLFCVIIFD